MPGAGLWLAAVTDPAGCAGCAVVVCTPPTGEDAVTVPQPAATTARRQITIPLDRTFI
jgi:hypothetical protein